MKKAIILINALGPDAGPDVVDVLNQAEAIEYALLELGYATERLFLDLDLKHAALKLQEATPHFIFNLVESLDGSGNLIQLGPTLLEHLKIPFTGCGSEAMYTTSNKILAKTLMQQKGIPTPHWFEDPSDALPDKHYIAKPMWEDASLGIGDGNILPGDPVVIRNFLGNNRNYRYFFEEYIDGREFNISLLAGTVLPVAEIEFRGYPAGKPRIVGYEAKWQEGSFEYENTVRSFGLESRDVKLSEQLKDICLHCWSLFGLSGYARVDFRVDQMGRPWVLEVNANPCLSPDAGFVAAADRAGYGYTRVVERIIKDIWKV